MKFKLKLIIISVLLLISIIASFLFFNANRNFNENKKNKLMPVIVGFAQLGSESAWRNANSESVKKAAKDAEISLIFKNAEGSQEAQKQIIRDFIIEQVDVIIFPPLVATGWDDILTEAKNAKIPVIISDRTIEPNNQNLYSAFVGADFELEGRKAAKWLLANTANNQKINIVELEGLTGSSPAVGRSKGFRSVISNHSNITFLESVPGDFIKAKGKLEMKKLLKKYGRNITVVFSHNDDMSLGAIEAIEEYGLRPGKDILIISFDGGRDALKAIKARKLNVSVECTPLLGPILMQTARKILKNEKVSKKVVMEEKTFTIKNVDKELPLRTY